MTGGSLAPDRSPRVRLVRAASAAFAVCAALPVAQASTPVSVVLPDGAPAVGAVVVDPATDEPRRTDAAGVAQVAGEPLEATCRLEGYLPGVAIADGARIVCALRAAARVAGTVVSNGCERDCEARLIRRVADSEATTEVAAVADVVATEDRALGFDFGVVEPGRYGVEIARTDDAWACRSPPLEAPAGAHDVVVSFREPARVEGHVSGPDASPLIEVPVRVWRYPSAASDALTVCGPDGSLEPLRASVPDLLGRLGTAWVRAMRRAGDPPAPDAATRSDGEGRFSLLVDPGASFALVAGGWDDPSGLAFALLAEAPERALRLTPLPTSSVVARVVHADDDTPASCDALLEPHDERLAVLWSLLDGSELEASCDRSGRLALGPMPAGRFDLPVDVVDAMPVEAKGEATGDGEPVDLGTLRAPRGERLAVRVFDEDERPVEGATVEVLARGGLVVRLERDTDALGEVHFAGLPEEARLGVEVRAEGFLPVSLDDRASTDSPLEIELRRGTRVRGTVIDTDDDPVAGADVSTGSATATTDASGAFSLDAVEAGPARLVAKARGYRQVEPVVVAVERGEPVDGVEIVVARAKGLTGTVVDPTGRPAAGATVRLQARGGAVLAETYSAPDGGFDLSRAPDPGTTLVARRDGYGAAVERSPAARAGEPIELRLTDPARLAVSLPADVDPITPVTVRDEGGVRRLASERRSRIEVDGLTPGPGSASLGAGPSVGFELVAGETVEVRLTEGATIEGRVTVAGVLAPRTVVSLGEVSERSVSGGALAEITDVDGRFRFESVPGPTRLAVAESPEGRAERLVDVPESGTIVVDLDIMPTVLELAVVDPDGLPVRGANASAQPTGEGAPSAFAIATGYSIPEAGLGYETMVSNCGCAQAVSRPDGVARLKLPEPRLYQVGVSADGYGPWNDALAVDEGTTRIEVTLEPEAERRLFVELLTDPPGLSGMLSCRYPSSSSATNGVAGPRAECPDPKAGAAQVLFHVDGYGRGHAFVDVPESGDVEVTVRVRRGGDLLIPFEPDPEGGRPPIVVTDAAGVDWASLVWRARVESLTPEGAGRAIVYPDLPEGTYRVVIGEQTRAPVEVTAGARTIAW